MSSPITTHGIPTYPFHDCLLRKSLEESADLESYLATRTGRDLFWAPYIHEDVREVSIGTTFRRALRHLFLALQESWDLECPPDESSREDTTQQFIGTVRRLRLNLHHTRAELLNLLRAFGGAQRLDLLRNDIPPWDRHNPSGDDDEDSDEDEDEEDENTDPHSQTSSSMSSQVLGSQREYFTAPSNIFSRPSTPYPSASYPPIPYTNGNGRHTPVTPPDADVTMVNLARVPFAPTSIHPAQFGEGRDPLEHGWTTVNREDGYHWVRKSSNPFSDGEDSEDKPMLDVDEVLNDDMMPSLLPSPDEELPVVNNELALFKDEPFDISLPEVKQEELDEFKVPAPIPGYVPSDELNKVATEYLVSGTEDSFNRFTEQVQRQIDALRPISEPTPEPPREPSPAVSEVGLHTPPPTPPTTPRSPPIILPGIRKLFPPNAFKSGILRSGLTPPFYSASSPGIRCWRRLHPGPSDPQSLTEIFPDWNYGHPIWIKRRNIGISCHVCRQEGHTNARTFTHPGLEKIGDVDADFASSGTDAYDDRTPSRISTPYRPAGLSLRKVENCRQFSA
ncbi:hypothetical protein CONPUDRAFT_149547 [Coniophora puteana RWD-64-598 SS2]|uniref:Uncharacterized protein n=1 Tax=Coniophora puteana (strain RWD-64-598) TaxID=741705 RepID=A0A5M3N1B3_CONPW|nr:uncharacterized protein CONPUDRAFT_149547 [Coniophora puteana RWD-64-598 SS2]EIW84671.1 hypothetical protein CONPUDRAFT_149547 [Coniophora puteana RWD-64-598 SS2]